MKYLVWVKDDPSENVPECYSVGKTWTPNGEGPLSLKTAERIAKESTSRYTRVRVLECGLTPIDLY